jgi:hypothetical protein
VQACAKRRNAITKLIDLKNYLRRQPKADRQSLRLDERALVEGYVEMRASAPRRAQGYLSTTRLGFPSSGAYSNRGEEHLAIALWRRGELVLPNGDRLRVLDYQTPLKSVLADSGIGKIDLLGLSADATLVVSELKLPENEEDRRIGLVEGLIYAANVEANIAQIATEFGNAYRRTILRAPPRVFLIAPAAYWSNRAHPSTGEIATLAGEVARAIPLDITFLCLCDAELEMGLNGRPPSVKGHAYLSPLSDQAAVDRPSRAPGAVEQSTYHARLRQMFWDYRRSAFPGADDLFKPHKAEGKDPVVFRAAHVSWNLLLPPGRPEIVSAIETMLTPDKRHPDFASMRSSQALEQFVFAGLKMLDRLDVLITLAAEDGFPAFFDSAAGYQMTLEHEVSGLGEPTPTSIDAFFFEPTKVAVEVKFGEDEFGRCSRPRLTPDKPNYTRDHCDGSFTVQRGRKARCSLSERGIRYWEFLPQLFAWSGEQDHRPCPSDLTYQLARNVLAACVGEGDTFAIENGHVLVIYDSRNPSVHPSGAADVQWWAAVRALRYPRLLRRVSWQRIAVHLTQFRDLDWLTSGLRAKYGIECEDPASRFAGPRYR